MTVGPELELNFQILSAINHKDRGISNKRRRFLSKWFLNLSIPIVI